MLLFLYNSLSQTIPVLQTREANLKRKVEDLSSLQQLQEKLKDLMNMHAWAQVVAEEKVRQQWATLILCDVI